MPWPDRRSVLVPIDFSEASFAALDEALSMVASPSDVRVIHVLPDMTSEPEFLREALDSRGRELRAETALRASLAARRHAGIEVLIRSGDPGEVIAQTADQLDCELVVMPSRGRSGLTRLLLGSVTERVLRLAHCPVLVLRKVV